MNGFTPTSLWTSGQLQRHDTKAVSYPKNPGGGESDSLFLSSPTQESQYFHSIFQDCLPYYLLDSIIFDFRFLTFFFPWSVQSEITRLALLFVTIIFTKDVFELKRDVSGLY